jgi:hypothetical protein
MIAWDRTIDTADHAINSSEEKKTQREVQNRYQKLILLKLTHPLFWLTSGIDNGLGTSKLS